MDVGLDVIVNELAFQRYSVCAGVVQRFVDVLQQPARDQNLELLWLPFGLIFEKVEQIVSAGTLIKSVEDNVSPWKCVDHTAQSLDRFSAVWGLLPLIVILVHVFEHAKGLSAIRAKLHKQRPYSLIERLLRTVSEPK